MTGLTRFAVLFILVVPTRTAAALVGITFAAVGSPFHSDFDSPEIESPERLLHTIGHGGFHLDIGPVGIDVDTAQANIPRMGRLVYESDNLRREHGLAASQINANADHAA